MQLSDIINTYLSWLYFRVSASGHTFSSATNCGATLSRSTIANSLSVWLDEREGPMAKRSWVRWPVRQEQDLSVFGASCDKNTTNSSKAHIWTHTRCDPYRMLLTAWEGKFPLSQQAGNRELSGKRKIFQKQITTSTRSELWELRRGGVSGSWEIHLHLLGEDSLHDNIVGHHSSTTRRSCAKVRVLLAHIDVAMGNKDHRWSRPSAPGY